jgi:1,4-dihydroxy-2-naphthoate polyprenyltransferase
MPYRRKPLPTLATLQNWKAALLTVNLSAGKPADAVSRWLIMTRAAVLPMTLISGLIGGLLAVQTAHPNWLYLVVCLAGLSIAHASNNLTNDYFDLSSGVDTSTAPRALYAPHPVLAGWTSRSGLLRSIVALNMIDAAIMFVLFLARGWPVIMFAAAGLFISVFYVAPPLRLKHRGLGEPGVLIVWGPLMVCGTYFVTAGELPAWVWVASLPYAVLVASVLIGKHIDKASYDTGQQVRTLPVILGEKASLRLNQFLMCCFYVITLALVAGRVFGPWALVVLLSLPVLWRTLALYSRQRPETQPAGYPIWPLWYAASAFVHARRAGSLFVLGLFLNWAAGSL